MSKPLAICIEDLDAPATSSQYTRCVALPGRQPGLRLDEAGHIVYFAACFALSEVNESLASCLQHVGNHEFIID